MIRTLSYVLLVNTILLLLVTILSIAAPDLVRGNNVIRAGGTVSYFLELIVGILLPALLVRKRII